jgi:hypothetical protein
MNAGLLARSGGLVLVCVLVLTGAGLNPFGSLVPDRPWSRCGADLCACRPAEPVCPLCPEDETGPAGGCGERSCADESAGLARRPERLGPDLPMLAELLGASLVIRVAPAKIRIEAPRVCGVSRAPGVSPDGRGSDAIDPPPPRGRCAV